MYSNMKINKYVGFVSKIEYYKKKKVYSLFYYLIVHDIRANNQTSCH